MPVVEFTVEGPPVSHQTKDRAILQVWQRTIRQAAARVWTGPPMTGSAKFTVMNFYEAARPQLDDDNMAKPIRDALNGIVYNDDGQITHAEHSQTSIDAYFQIRGTSLVILEAFHRGKEFVYIRIEDAPTHTQLPK